LAVLGRVLLNSAERIDLPDLLSIDSYGAGDWKYFMQSLVGTSKPYILSGFDVIEPGNAIGLPTCSFRVADSIVYYPGAAAGPFFYGLPEGNSASIPLVPQLRTNATNYVYLTLSTFDTSIDTRALWDPDRNGGDGGEFTQDINTESVIQAQLGISTGSFPVNTVPLAIVVVGATTITSITDSRDMLFRLGTGGIAPDPQAEFVFPSLPDVSYARSEPVGTMSHLSDPNPFQGGDKNIKTLKQWMDAVMTKLKELGGTAYWYEDTTTFSLINLFHDALTTTWKSKGSYTHSSATPGELSWTEDVYIKSMASPVDIVVRASGGSPITLANEQVAFLSLVRDQPINSLDQSVAFTLNQAYVNTATGATGSFGLLKKGDWIKKATDDETLFLQVRAFYNTAQPPGGPISGTETTPGDARSIILNDVYKGTTSPPGGDRARFNRGEYTTAVTIDHPVSDIKIVNRNDASLSAAAGDLLWFAQRSDTVMDISSISTVSVTGTVTTADGTGAIVSATAHGLVDGDRITVTAPGAQAGTYTIDKIDNDTFTFKTANTTTGAFTGFYGLAITQVKDEYGFQLESANHGFDSGETIVVSGTTNFNAAYTINVRSSTQFQFPIGAAYPTETAAPGRVATLARMDVRSEEGITKVVQGETIEIGSGTIENMQAFIGMTSLNQTFPVYDLPGSYGTFNNGANYNGSLTDNLTARVSKNTAMLMDKAQDKTVKYLTDAIEASVQPIGDPRVLSFSPPNSHLTILQPGGVGNAVIALSNITLSANQSAYVVIDRNSSSTPGFAYAPTSAVPVSENVFVIASRLTGDEVYLWNGQCVQTTTPLAPSDVPLVQCDFFDPLSTELPIGDPVAVDNNPIQAGQLVVFGALTANPNQLYKAIGVGTNITSWEAQYSFHGRQNPTNADTIMVRSGQGFARQIGKFNGTNWVFNDYVRYFNGADYWEQSNLVSTTLADANMTTVFSTNWAGSEHMILDFSIVRNGARETGTMRIVTDGARAEVSTDSAYINGNSGVTFTASLDDPMLSLNASTTSTGHDAQMKYSIRRWSSSFPGGPGGVPVYSGAAPAPTPAHTPVDAVQFNLGGVLSGNSNFKIDIGDISMSFNGLRQGVLSSGITINNNQVAAANLAGALLDTAYPFYIVEYSITKNTFARVGHLTIAYDGTNVACNDSYVETGATGVVLTAIVSGDIQLQYTSTAGTGPGEFKYAWRKWI
jgi:hypothetical protein